VSDHPHRGFATCTYLLQGEVEHNDSKGNHGVIEPGGIQWMSAGSGLVHSEFPSTRMSDAGGILQGLQIWINFPSGDKMSDPTYFDYTAQQLPVITQDNYTLRVISGEYESVRSPVATYSPVFIAHLTLKAGSFAWNINEGYNAGFIVLDNSVQAQPHNDTNSVTLSAGQLGVVEDTETVVISTSQPTNIMLLSGQPLNEPVARYGPFVMNTKAQIQEAFEDYNSGVLS
jgi:hypothetical protein